MTSGDQLGSIDPLGRDATAAVRSVETDIYRVNWHPLHDPSTFWGGLANPKKVSRKSRKGVSYPPGDPLDR